MLGLASADRLVTIYRLRQVAGRFKCTPCSCITTPTDFLRGSCLCRWPDFLCVFFLVFIEIVCSGLFVLFDRGGRAESGSRGRFDCGESENV